MNTVRRTDAWGRIIVDPASLFELLYKGFDVATIMVEDNPLVDQYNEWCAKFDKPAFLIEAAQEPTNTPEEEHAARAGQWFMPPEFKTIDVRAKLLAACETAEQRARVNMEMDMFEARGLEPLLRMMMHLVHHFRANGVVWGVGRGSSVASYCLYLIGVHRIDSLKYGLAIDEFLK